MAAMGRQPARAEGKSLKQIKMAHGHSHGSACCHDHDHDSEDPAVLFTLYQKVIIIAASMPSISVDLLCNQILTSLYPLHRHTVIPYTVV